MGPHAGVGSLGMVAAQPLEVFRECKPHVAGFLSVPAVNHPQGSGFAFASSEQRQGELQLLLSPFSVVQRRHLAQGDSAQQRKLCQVPFHLDGLLSEHFSSAFLSGGLMEHQLSCLSGYAEY